MQPKSIVSKNDVWRLPCHADAPGDVPTDRTVIPLKSPAGHESAEARGRKRISLIVPCMRPWRA